MFEVVLVNLQFFGQQLFYLLDLLEFLLLDEIQELEIHAVFVGLEAQLQVFESDALVLHVFLLEFLGEVFELLLLVDTDVLDLGEQSVHFVGEVQVVVALQVGAQQHVVLHRDLVFYQIQSERYVIG